MNTNSNTFGTEAEEAFVRDVAAMMGRRMRDLCGDMFRVGPEAYVSNQPSDHSENNLTEEMLMGMIARFGRKPFEPNGKIIPNKALVEQFRFPKSRKKRIRRKWANRPENFRPLKNAWILEDGTIYAHPDSPIFRADIAKSFRAE